MSAPRVPISRGIGRRFAAMIRALAISEVGGKARLLFGLLIVFLLGINGLNVVNSFVGRDFMTSIENRNMARFIEYALIYVGVFAASTVVAVYYRYCEERLGLLWRKWLTEQALERYLKDRTYFRLHAAGDLQNPDQRIAEDIRALTATTLSFFLMLLNASLTVIAFSGVLWSISPLLFVVAMLYAATGSAMTWLLGRTLIGLNYDQLDREANFRARLVHVRENAESIALLQREGRLRIRLHDRLERLTANFQRIIEVNRNLGFFTTGYNYLIQIIPALIVAPMFIRGQAEFGVITQSAMAFGHLLGAFSLIVTQFQSISVYTAVIARLGALAEAMDRAVERRTPPIDYCTDCERVAFEGVSLRSPRSGRYLVKELNLSIPRGTHVLIRVPDEPAKTALFRATAGIWDQGEGRILRPSDNDLLFLPERPYVPPGTLREVLLHGRTERRFSDERLLGTLRSLDLIRVVDRAGGLDTEQTWSELLSLGEQQLLAFSRVLLADPSFVFLDHPNRALSECQVDGLLALLRERGITYLTLGDEDDDETNYDQRLDIAGDGSWTLSLLPAEKGPRSAPPEPAGAAAPAPSSGSERPD
ncbi:ABC transporter transmembrane domain-containing protein [Thioalkalicoccus limnaeus]|uniref:ABC transporter transmembrane domain-containing protein n=1 Tax=Thioalkalicoccus limnaeus TaxID=120681 RepID=A0ABV4BBV3_9GAMM